MADDERPAFSTHELEAGGFAFTVRLYEAQEPHGASLVWLHGGAFMGGTTSMPEAHQVALRHRSLGTTVVSVEYTLGPRHALAGPLPPEDGGPDATDEMRAAAAASRRPRSPYPTASLQTAAAFHWARDVVTDLGGDPHRVCLGGASAGGNLSAGAAVRLRDAGGPMPAGLVLVYPALHADLPEPDAELAAALADHGTAADLHPEIMQAVNDAYLGGASSSEVYAYPGGHDMRRMPRTLIINADVDRLRPSGEAFAAELARAGVDVAVVRERGTRHGYLNTAGDPAADRSLARMEAFVRATRRRTA